MLTFHSYSDYPAAMMRTGPLVGSQQLDATYGSPSTVYLDVNTQREYGVTSALVQPSSSQSIAPTTASSLPRIPPAVALRPPR